VTNVIPGLEPARLGVPARLPAYAVLPVSVTLTGNRTRGSFSGTLFGGVALLS
jgi:hypothetical protein